MGSRLIHLSAGDTFTTVAFGETRIFEADKSDTLTEQAAWALGKPDAAWEADRAQREKRAAEEAERARAWMAGMLSRLTEALASNAAFTSLLAEAYGLDDSDTPAEIADAVLRGR